MGNKNGGGGKDQGKKTTTTPTPSKPVEQKQPTVEIKLLLLGSGESGKSTFFKQIKAIHENEPYSEEEILNYKSSIYANILHAIKVLSVACLKMEQPFENSDNIALAKSVVQLAENDQSLLLNAVEVYTIDVHNKVKNLWKDAHIQKAFAERRYEFHVFDGAQYFFGNFDKLAPPKYVPNSEDILHCRRKTIGLVSSNFVFNGAKFQIFDVGGQRNERKKWEKSFNGVSAVLYVACLSEFDQKCYEDDITNRMLESLELFETTINNNFFKDKTIILFLNKLDVFETKIQTKDMSQTFPEYEGGNDKEKGIEFIKQKYASCNKGKSERLLMHLTCATKRDDVERVMNDVKKYLSNNIGDKL